MGCACLSDALAKLGPRAMSAMWCNRAVHPCICRVVRVLVDALDVFPSDVAWAAQYVLDGSFDALCIVCGFVPGSKLQQLIKVCIVFSIIGLQRSHIFGLCTLEVCSVMEQPNKASA